MIIKKIKAIKNRYEKPGIAITNNYIITSYDYKGITVYDYNLRKVKKILILKDFLIIEKMYPQFSKNCILLSCYENQLVWINIETEEFKIIPLGEFSEVIFSDFYWWEKDDEILISDYSHNIYQIVVSTGIITKLSDKLIEKNHPTFFEIWQRCKFASSDFFFPNSHIIGTINVDNSAAILYDYQTSKKIRVIFPLPKTQAIAYHSEFLALINEKQLDILSSDGRRITIPAEYPWRFARAVFLPGYPLKLVVSSINRGYLMLYEIKND